MNEQLFESRMGSRAVSPFLSDFLENSEEKKWVFLKNTLQMSAV